MLLPLVCLFLQTVAVYTAVYCSSNTDILKSQQHTTIRYKDGYKHHTGSCEGGIEAVEMPPLPLRTIMFNDVFRAEVIGSMCRSKKEKKNYFLISVDLVDGLNIFHALKAYRKTVPSSASFTRFPSSRSTTSPLKLNRNVTC